MDGGNYLRIMETTSVFLIKRAHRMLSIVVKKTPKNKRPTSK